MSIDGMPNPMITQVCLIVDDLQAYAARWSQIMGIDLSGNIQTTLPHASSRVTYFGQPTDARASLIAADTGHLQFELLQPLNAPSSWHDYLDQHGAGIHHIGFFVPETDPAVKSFARYGYQVAQQGLFTERNGVYTYLDTDRDLGVVIELLEHFDGSPALTGSPFPADKGIGTDIVTQVGIIVRDIERTSQRFSDVFGLAKPPIIITSGYAQSKTTYHGQPSEATAKLAFFDLGQVQIELIEPDAQPSVWRDFLDQHGEGAQHIAFQVQNTQRAVDDLAQFGIAVAQQGLYTDASGLYTYMDSPSQLGTTIELLENFKR